jgi:hypothetical protein
MSDDTQVQDTPPQTADNSPAAAPVDQAGALSAREQALINAAVAAALNKPGPAPVSPTSVPTSGAAAAKAPAEQSGDEQPYSEVFKAGSLAVHTYDHFGRETHQVLVVLGTYEVDVLDKRGNPTGARQTRVKFLPIGTASQAGDLPADAPELLPADAFDWEEPV